MAKRFDMNTEVILRACELFGDIENEEIIDREDAIYLREQLERSRRCLNRPERSVYEAIEHIERALILLNKVLT